jgi:hypothetical protein
MRPRDLAHDIQSQPETAVGVAAVPVLRASPERVKHLIQGGLLNCRPAVRDLEPDVGLFASESDTNRSPLRAILDGVRDEVAEQLLQARAVPVA